MMPVAGHPRGDQRFERWLRAWDLVADGPPIKRASSDLLPVRTAAGQAAMLKRANDEDEQRAAPLMRWWDGFGAARVMASDAVGVVLLERADGSGALAHWARHGRDQDATRVLCDVIARLHAPRTQAHPAGLVPLQQWFAALAPAARTHGGALRSAADIADRLLSTPRDVVPLHGDIHHDNVLDFGPRRGWLAIDPKGLLGEQGFDYANLFCNPQPPGEVSSDVALRPGVFEQRLHDVLDISAQDPARLIGWIAAYAGLSAAWLIADGDDAALPLQVASYALDRLDR